MQRLTRRAFSTVAPKMELTIRTPYKTLFNKSTNFKGLNATTIDGYYYVNDKTPASVRMLLPGSLSVQPDTDSKDFVGNFVHTGGWLVVHENNTCEVFLMEAIEQSEFKSTPNTDLSMIQKEDADAAKWIQDVRDSAERSYFRAI